MDLKQSAAWGLGTPVLKDIFIHHHSLWKPRDHPWLLYLCYPSHFDFQLFLQPHHLPPSSSVAQQYQTAYNSSTWSLISCLCPCLSFCLECKLLPHTLTTSHSPFTFIAIKFWKCTPDVPSLGILPWQGLTSSLCQVPLQITLFRVLFFQYLLTQLT